MKIRTLSNLLLLFVVLSFLGIISFNLAFALKEETLKAEEELADSLTHALFLAVQEDEWYFRSGTVFDKESFHGTQRKIAQLIEKIATENRTTDRKILESISNINSTITSLFDRISSLTLKEREQEIFRVKGLRHLQYLEGKNLVKSIYEKRKKIHELFHLAGNGLTAALGFTIIFFLFYLRRRIHGPLLRLEEGFAALSTGNFAYRTDLRRNDEFGLLARNFDGMAETLQSTTVSVEGLKREIEKRRETEATLREEEEKLRRLSQEFHTLLNAIPDNLTLQDRDLKILWANRGAAHSLNLSSSEEIVGKYCYTLWHNRTAPCEICPVQECFKTKREAEATVYTPDGRIWDLRAVPLFGKGDEVVNVIEVGRDVTVHRKLEAQLLQAQKMEAIGLMAGSVAHDFNNILSAIMGYCQLALIKEKRGEPLSHYLEQIVSSCERAAAMTQGLLAFSRKQPANFALFDLNDLVRGFEKFLRRLVREDICLKYLYAEEKLPVMVDRGQIEQVIMNLVTNAQDAMPRGGGLTIETRSVYHDEELVRTHGYGKAGEYAVLIITDTGVGMDKNTLQRVFEPFFTTKSEGKGTGLGLSIVYGIVKRHEGFVNIYSEPGQGTTVKVYLPMARGKVIEAREEAPVEETLPTGKETILLAEDDQALREALATTLKTFGYTVIEAADGEEALEKFDAHRETLDLLILDAIMPRINGRQVYEKIKSIKPYKTIIISGYSKDIFAQNGIPLTEEVIFLSKPISPVALLKRVREVLGEIKSP